MGLDKIYNTFYRIFGGNEDMEENDFSSNFKYIPAETILVDGNFIIYQAIYQLEKDLNNILKIILAMNHNSIIKRNELKNKLDLILKKDGLKEHYNYLGEIFIEKDIDIMINLLKEKSFSEIINDIIVNYYFEYIKKKVLENHYEDFIKNFYLIFDGIPSGFKIVEQRRRRIKNYLESHMRKDILINNKTIDDNLILEEILDDVYILDYNKYVKNMITLKKSYGPSSNIFKKISIKLKYYFDMRYKNISFWCSGVSENGEADFKIIHLCRLCKDKNIVIHCSDFDFIILCSRIQNELVNKIYMIRHFKKKYLIINFMKLNERIKNYINNKYNVEKDIKIIDDFYFIMNLFGNDYLPCLKELSFDINFLNVLEMMSNLWNNKKFILNNEKLNLKNLKLLLVDINNNNFGLKNYLKSNFICNEIIKIIDELKNINDIIELNEILLLPFWYKKILELNSWDDIYDKDIRIDLIQKYLPKLKKELLKVNINSIKNELLKKDGFTNILNKNIVEYNDILELTLKPYYPVTIGLKKKENNDNFGRNSYDNLYNYYYNKCKNDISKKYKNLENNNDENFQMLNGENYNNKIYNEKNVVDNYLLTLELINYKFYNPMKLSFNFYKFYKSPKIRWIIDYINKYDLKIEDHIEDDMYLDPKIHLMIISINDIKEFNFINNINKILPDLIFLDKSTFNLNNNILNKKINNYKNIDIKKMKNIWNDYLLNVKHNILIQKDLILSSQNFNVKLDF